MDDLVRRQRPSLFWDHELERFWARLGDRSVAELSDAELSRLLKDYRFRELDAGIVKIKQDPELQRALGLLRTVNERLKHANFGAFQTEHDRDVWEHMCALGHLKKLGIINQYLAFIEAQRVGSDMSAARHFVYMLRLEQLMAAREYRPPLAFLEIGGGAGNLAGFLCARELAGVYVIVDLVEMLLHASFCLASFFPAARLHFNHVPDDLGSSGQLALCFLTPDRIDLPPDRAFDVALNFNSFMEMDELAPDGIYRVTRCGGLFFNVNRRQRLQQRDGVEFDNNPLLYPYAAEDRVVLWEDDAFQQTTRSWFNFRPTLAIARAAVVNEVPRD